MCPSVVSGARAVGSVDRHVPHAAAAIGHNYCQAKSVLAQYVEAHFDLGPDRLSRARRQLDELGSPALGLVPSTIACRRPSRISTSSNPLCLCKLVRRPAAHVKCRAKISYSPWASPRRPDAAGIVNIG